MSGFELEIDGVDIEELDSYTILGTIEDFEYETDKFIVLRPQEPIEGSIYLQASILLRKPTDERIYHIETRIVQANGYTHYRYRTSDLEEIRSYFQNYYEHGQLPNLNKWEDVYGGRELG